MRLHSPQFERSLRRKVRQAVKNSRELRREFRAANKYRRRYSGLPLLRAVVSIVLWFALWTVMDRTGDTATGLAALSVWSLLFLPIHAQGLLSRLYTSSDLPALGVLPAPIGLVFRWQVQKFVRNGLWSLLDLAGGFTVLGVWHHLPATSLAAAAVLGVLAWLELLALAGLCVAYLPRFPYQLASIGAITALILVFMVRNLIGEALLAILQHAAPNLLLLLPTGWPASLFELLLSRRHWLLLGLLVPITGLICTLKSSLARLRRGYEFREPLLREAPDLLPGQDLAARFRTTPGSPLRVGPTAIEELIQGRAFLAPNSFEQAGLLERLLWRWFSPRERVVAELVFPNGWRTTAAWLKIFRNLGFTVAATGLTHVISPGSEFWLLAIGLFVTGCQALGHVLHSGRAFQPIWCSGANVPLYAGYAVGFRELARLLFKCAAVQLPLLLPYTLLASVLGFYFISGALVEGVLFGIKAAALLVLGQLITVTFGFSSGTNDTSFIRWRSLALILVMLVLGLGFLGCAAGCLFVPDQKAAFILGGVSGLSAYAMFQFYGWFYNANRFDLLSNPRQ